MYLYFFLSFSTYLSLIYLPTCLHIYLCTYLPFHLLSTINDTFTIEILKIFYCEMRTIYLKRQKNTLLLLLILLVLLLLLHSDSELESHFGVLWCLGTPL